MVCSISENPGKGTSFNGPDKRSGATSQDNNQTDNNGGEEKRETGYNSDKPPEDDCCPICFGDFTVPCKTNCGHWFCGSCILQLWKHRWRPQQCTCPFCSSAINMIVPEASAVAKTEAEVFEVLANIEHYNSFYAKGMDGFSMILRVNNRKIDLLFDLLQTLFMILTKMATFIKNLLEDPGRERPMLRTVCMMTFTLGLIVYSHCGIFPSDPPRPKLAEYKMWVEFSCLILAYLPSIAMLCMNWIQIRHLALQIEQHRMELNDLEQEIARWAQEFAFRAQEAA